MPSPHIPRALEKLVRERAGGRCEYCRAAEQLSGQPCQIDHILPRAHGGPTTPENLCLACVPCNSFKLDRTEGVDPATGDLAPLFNPRRQNWNEHFAWGEDGVEVAGLTPCGRATVETLRLNRPLALAARAIWVSIRRHPPA